ncbi:transposase [Micromonospora chersina]|uniref:transposase n=1 Tax=Micromonospora chersina TaxID=47854 RepID=UPI003F57FC60
MALIAALNGQISALESEVSESFHQHPDAEIYLSQPGLGAVLAARVLAEFGDDSDRYPDARSRKNYAGNSPITRQSGKKLVVLARYARNDRLADAVHQQAFCALTASPGARAYYDELRSRGTNHHAALRQLANRLTGILHGCLKTGTHYDEATAWATAPNSPLDVKRHGMSDARRLARRTVSPEGRRRRDSGENGGGSPPAAGRAAPEHRDAGKDAPRSARQAQAWGRWPREGMPVVQDPAPQPLKVRSTAHLGGEGRPPTASSDPQKPGPCRAGSGQLRHCGGAAGGAVRDTRADSGCSGSARMSRQGPLDVAGRAAARSAGGRVGG